MSIIIIPGAKILIHCPILVKSVNLSNSSIAPTVIAWGDDAGVKLHEFEWKLFPAATTTCIPAANNFCIIKFIVNESSDPANDIL